MKRSTKSKRFIFLIIFFVALGGGLVLLSRVLPNTSQQEVPTVQEQSASKVDQELPAFHQEVAEAVREIEAAPKDTSVDNKQSGSQAVVQKVPFTSQAPSGQWSDPVFQNGCEEASMLMAHAWSAGQALLERARIEQQIRELSGLAFKKFGEGTYDTSAEDTAALFREYFHANNVSVRHNVSLEDMRQTLLDGKVIIVPVNGQKLHNPNFTAPGPEYHMLIVIGYDPAGKEFVTNDPGTRKGAGYRYAERVLFDAMRDYPTGHHEKVTAIDKAMIVAEKP